MLILVAGWFFTQFMGNVAREQVRKDNVTHGKLIIQRLTFELEEAEAAVKAMSGSPWISPALWSRSPQTLAQANSVLDRYQTRFEASPAYILDQTGTCIASSNRDAPDSFVGHNYAFRPYFQQAMAGQPGRYFALGVVSKKRGFFAAYPVRDPVGKIVGIAAIKTTLDRFQQELRESDPAFLIDPDGVIFLGSRPSLDYHSLWPVNPADREGLKAQYGTANFESVFPQPPTDGAAVKIDGKNYLFYRQDINAPATPGWSLVLLAPVNLVVFYRLLGIATAFIVVVLTLVSVGTNLSIREGANRIVASEARFRAMFAAAPEAVFVFDPETRRILDANPFMAQWLGYGPEELVGLEIDQFRSPESPGAQEECAGQGAEGPHRSPGPRIIGKKMVLWLMWSALRPTFSMGIISARSCLSGILPNASRPKMRSGKPKNTWKISWRTPPTPSASWTSTAGSSNGIKLPSRPSAILSLSLKENLPLSFMPTRIELQGILTQLRRDGSVHGYEIHMKKKDGGIALFALSINLLYDRDHKVIGSVCVARDLSEIKKALDDLAIVNQRLQHEVTERKQMEVAIQETNRGLQTILDNVQTGVLIIDPETHVIVDANPVAVELIGAPQEEIIGSECNRFICRPEHGRCAVTDLGETVVNAERVLRRPDGTTRWVMQTVVPVSLQGKERLLESYVDITERRQWEETLQTTNDKLHTLVAQVEERNHTMTLANEMADMLQACQVSEEAYEAIGHFMPRLFPMMRGPCICSIIPGTSLRPWPVGVRPRRSWRSLPRMNAGRCGAAGFTKWKTPRRPCTAATWPRLSPAVICACP